MRTIPSKPEFMSGSYTPSFKHINDAVVCVDVRIHTKDSPASDRATATQRRAFVKYLRWYYEEYARLGSIEAMKEAYPSIFPKITVRTKKED